MTKIYILLCVLFLPVIFADLFNFRDPFGKLAIASFEESRIVENSDRDARDTKKTDDPVDRVIGTPKAFVQNTQTNEAKRQTDASPTPQLNEEKMKELIKREGMHDISSDPELLVAVSFVEHAVEKRGNKEETSKMSTLQDDAVSRDDILSTLGSSSNSPSVQLTSSAGSMSTVAPSEASVSKDIKRQVEVRYLDLAKLQDGSNMSQGYLASLQGDTPTNRRMTRNSFIEEYKTHLVDRFRSPTIKDMEQLSSASPQETRKCSREEPSFEASVNTMDDAEIAEARTLESIDDIIQQGDEVRIDTRNQNDAIVSSQTPETLTDHVSLEVRLKRSPEPTVNQMRTTSVKYDDSDDEELVEEEEPEPKEIAAKKRNSSKRWGHWGMWSPCSSSCGVGKVTRWRHCVGEGCAPGEKEAQIKTCTQPAC